jgi:5-methylthioadenosine/S-adenosylhomocysteine deaminase
LALAFVGGYVLTMDPGLGDFPDGTLVVEGSRIAAVGPRDRVPVPPGARVVDARGSAILPGLVNCHNHAAMALLRGYGADLPLRPWLEEKIWPAEARLTGEDVYWGTLLAAGEMLRGGTTTFADMYFFMDDAARAVEEAGIRAVLSRGLIGAAPDARQKLREGADFCRRWQGGAGGRITTMVAPHAEYTCPPDFLREAAAAARDLGVPLHIHLSETAAEVADCRRRHGVSPPRLLADLGLLELPVLAAHAVHLDDDDVALLAQAGVGVAHNPVSNCKLASGVARVVDLLEAGVRVGIGTDGPASTDALGMWGEMRLAGWLQKVTRGNAAALPARRILEMATRVGADILGLGSVCGRLAPGLAADVVVVDLQRPHLVPHDDVAAALVYGASDADVSWVVVDGRVRVERGQVTGLDLERAMAEATARGRRLREGSLP